MAASSPTDVHIPARIVIVTAIGHSRVWIDKASRGAFDIDARFFLGRLRSGSNPFVQVVAEAHKTHEGSRFVVPRTNEKKIYTYKKPFSRNNTNCQKRQLYGSTNKKNKK